MNISTGASAIALTGALALAPSLAAMLRGL